MRAYWLYVMRGSFTPAFRQAYWTSPEQSNAPGPVAPHRYGSPICFLAAETALPAFTFCCAVLLDLAFAVAWLTLVGRLRRALGP